MSHPLSRRAILPLLGFVCLLFCSTAAAEAVLHHFVFDPLPSSLVRGQPISVTLRAVDSTGASVITYNQPLTIVAAGTTLAKPVTASAWVNGVWTGPVTPASFATSASFSVDDGAGATGTSASFAVVTGPFAALSWTPVPATQTIDTPISATLQAIDAGGNPLVDFSGSVALSGRIPQTLPNIGSATTSDSYPFAGTRGVVVRQQVLYPASALGGTPRRLTSLALNVTSTGNGVSFAQWTIRLKQSTRSDLSNRAFDTSGWTTVHVSTATPSATGWQTFVFSTPFDYDGTSSLLVDFSFRNATTLGSSISVSAAFPRIASSLYATSYTASADPSAFGTGTTSSYAPIIRLGALEDVGIRPSTATLTNGVWNGSISFAAVVSSAQLRATSTNPTAVGDSNFFAVNAPPPASPFPFIETWESGTFSANWAITGTYYHRSQIRTDHGPRTGARHLILDSSVYGTYSRNEATLSLNLDGRSGIVLSFWARSLNEDSTSLSTNPFTGSADFDGVAISPDGVTWLEVQPLRTPALTTSWQQFTINLDPFLAARGWSYTPAFRIRFNRFGNNIAPDDGIAIDDITVNTSAGIVPTITLPASLSESAGPLTGTLSLQSAPASDLVFTLTSSAPAKLSVPISVTLPAGQTSIDFAITPIDDTLFDGSRLVHVSAAPPSGSGFFTGVAALTLTDDDTPVPTLTFASSTVSEGSVVLATLTVPFPPSAQVTFTLSSSDITAATVPATVSFGAGQSSATFTVTPVNDTKIDGAQTTTITATLDTVSAGAELTVSDNETTVLSLNAGSATEGIPGSGSVSITGTLPTPLVVSLVSDNPAQLTVPASVTIPAGSKSAGIPLNAADDSDTDGTVTVNITASSAGFTSATGGAKAVDNDFHHFTLQAITNSPQLAKTTFPLNVYARTIDETDANFSNGNVSLSARAGASVLPVTASLFPVGYGWTGWASVNLPANGVTLHLDNSAGQTGVSSPFDVTTGPLDRFTVSAPSSSQVTAMPFPITITALDSVGNVASSFTGTAALSAILPTRAIGSGTGFNYLLLNGYQSRAQTIYLASELGGSGQLSGLAFDINNAPGVIVSDFTIRIKSTYLSSYSTSNNQWESSGWTLVYQGSPRVTLNGWFQCDFITPFFYDGTSNLLIDFSHNATNPPSGSIRCSNPDGLNRTLSCATNGLNSPLTWAGPTPVPAVSTTVPNLRFTVRHDTVAFSPATTSAFVNGVWSGDISASAAGSNVAIRAYSGNALGASNTFNVLPGGPDADADKLPDAWETAYGLDPASALTQNGRLGDPDGDGLPNLLEYAFGLDPQFADASAAISCTTASHPATGQRHLVVAHRRLLNPGTLIYNVATSSDLLTWTAPAIAPEVLSSVANPDGLTETVTLRINPALSTTPAFIRIEVAAP